VIQHGDPTDIVGHIARTIGVERVVWNQDYSRLARQRDRAVQRVLTRTGVTYTSVPTGQAARTSSSTTLPPDPEAYLANPHTLAIETREVPRLSDLREEEYDSAPLTAGTKSARKQLRALSNGTTYRRYDDGRSFLP